MLFRSPPIGSLFSAFLGFNPIKQLLGPTGALQQLPAHQVAYITGRSFFPKLIEQPFAAGLHLAFTFAAIATAIAILASAVRGRRYVHASEPVLDELAEGAAEAGGLAGLEPVTPGASAAGPNGAAGASGANGTRPQPQPQPQRGGGG